MSIKIVLIEPKIQGNLGAIARSMKNFGFKDLILVNPKCKIGKEARNRAKHANDILDKAKILKKWPKLDTLIATSGKTGNDYNILRNPISPRELKEIIPNKSVGLIFGREDKGLTNEELAKCDFMVKIPTNKNYPILNLSMAVTIMLYELSDLKNEINSISEAEKNQIMKMLDKAMNKMDFASEDKKNTQRLVWKKMISKSFMSRREAYALMGFLKKI